MENTTYRTPPCTIVYPELFEPKAFNNGEPKYSAVFLLSKDIDRAPLWEAIKAAAVRKFGGQILENMKSLRIPIRDGDEKAVDKTGKVDKESFYFGNNFISAKSKFKPQLINLYGDPVENESEIYGGCTVQAIFNFYGYSYMGDGVACGLQAVCKVGDGEPIGSNRVNTTEAFQGVIKDKPDAPPGWEEEKAEAVGGYGEMGEPFPGDRDDPPPEESDSIPF
jgi:hypothetical protein